MTTDLLPCPFCGGTDLYFPHGTDPAVIECSGCGARSGVPDEQAEAVAIAAWNRRADLSPSPEVVKELVDALRQAHEALLWCARDGRMASPLLHQYPAKWAAEVGAKLAKLEGGE